MSGDSSGVDVSNHVMEVNSVLVKNLVERFSEALSRINSTLEASSTIDERMLEQLKVQVDVIRQVKEDTTVFLLTGQGANSILQQIHEGLCPFFEDKPYHIEDRVKLISLVRRFSSTVANWSDAEKAVLLDSLEKAPSLLIKMQTKLSRLYFIVAAAGITAILTSVGAPEWIKKLFQLILGTG